MGNLFNPLSNTTGSSFSFCEGFTKEYFLSTVELSHLASFLLTIPFKLAASNQALIPLVGKPATGASALAGGTL